MATLDLHEGEHIRLTIQAQLAKGYPQTVGDLHLTNRRLILLPNQLLSVGFGKRWEISISDILNVDTKKPLQGGPFVGSAGNRLVLTMKDNSQHILSTLGDVTPLYQALSAQIAGQELLEGAATTEPSSSSVPFVQVEVGSSSASDFVPQPGTIFPSDPPKDPMLAALLSLLLAGGAGQIYLGQIKKGIAIILVSLALSCVGVGFITWILGIVDAYLIANRLKSGSPVGEMQFF